MAAKKKGLGKGLDALFVDNSAEEQGKAVLLPLSEVEPNKNQPRKDFDEDALGELADSIAVHGIIQPLLVRPLSGGTYQLVAGERRWRAARMAGLAQVPVVVREMSDGEVMELALIENLQREDLNAMEEAEGYRVLMEKYSFTQEEVAKRVGKSRPAVANAVRLMGLPENVQQYVREGRLSAGHARTLLSFDDPKLLQESAMMAVERGISVRELEERARRTPKSGKNKKMQRTKGRDPLFDEVELSLTTHLGRKVKVLDGKGKGTLEIEFYNKEDLQELANSIVIE